jgi:NAD+ synthase (glutamine-hydrolysing)
MRMPFNSIYSHHMLRVAVCIPTPRVADPHFNLEGTLALAREASAAHAAVALFPELGLSAYANEDLFHQSALLDAAREAVAGVVHASAALLPVLIVGAPLPFDGKLFNCAVVIHRGRVLGLVPKTYLPNYREFYEKRQFTSGRYATSREVAFLGARVPFGNDLIFAAENVEGFRLHVEICEDVWTPLPPSTFAALAGATLLANLSASNITIGKAEYRRSLCASQSAKCLAAYFYSAAGPGESTTDLAWDGHAMIYENGELLAEAERFTDRAQMITADIDLERLLQERMRMTSYNDALDECRERVQAVRRVPFEFRGPEGEVPLRRAVARFPYVPNDPRQRDERCYEAYNIQVHGLTQRLASAGKSRAIIGISGGLDSTQALIVTAKAMDRLKLPRANILAYTLPGFATSEHTLANARKLMQAFGVTAREVDIRPACEQMFRDLGHPFAAGDPVYDVTFENVQAGARTSFLFRAANQHDGLVIGTSDLSEFALGWCTYGVGDQMSHYAVNVSVPKTLIQHLIRWVAGSRQFDAATSATLASVLATEISPELVPASKTGSARPAQSTTDVIGPFDLQDFTLFYVTRYGLRPSKVAFLAHHAWSDRSRGEWPESLPERERNEYDLDAIKHWLGVFLRRFFQLSQFKRSAIPNGPKVGSGGSLSPRSDWRAPSDAAADAWLRELENIDRDFDE